MKRLLAHAYADRAPVERRCLHLWRCGARVVAEFLNDLALEHDIAEEINTKLEQYCHLNADVVTALGGDRFAHPPTRIVGGER